MSNPFYHMDDNGNIYQNSSINMPMNNVSYMVSGGEMIEHLADGLLKNMEKQNQITETFTKEIQLKRKEIVTIKNEKQALIKENISLKNALEYETMRGLNALTTAYLSYTHGVDYGLCLIRQKEGKYGRTCSYVGSYVIEDSILVKSIDDESFYYAIKFQDLSNWKNDSIIFINQEQIKSNQRLLSILRLFGITLSVKLSTAEIAELWRNYITRCTVSGYKNESYLGWSREEGRDIQWKYTRKESLPWWDRRHIEPSGTQNLVDMKGSLTRFISNPRLRIEEKILIYLPFISLHEPIIDEIGGIRERLINLVVYNMTPRIVAHISNLLGVNYMLNLSEKSKKFCVKLSEYESPIILIKADEMGINSAMKKELLRNLQSLKNISSAKPLPVLISRNPVSLLDDSECWRIEITPETVCSSYRFSKLRTNYEMYLENYAAMIAQRINIEAIPEITGDFGCFYELIRITQIAVNDWLNIDWKTELSIDVEDLKKYFSNELSNMDNGGLSQWFIECLEQALEKKVVQLIEAEDIIQPNTIIKNENEIYFSSEVLKKILTQGMSAFHELTVLKSLYSAGILTADESIKRCYKTRRKCTMSDGNIEYQKFIVLKKSEIIKTGDYDFLQ